MADIKCRNTSSFLKLQRQIWVLLTPKHLYFYKALTKAAIENNDVVALGTNWLT